MTIYFNSPKVRNHLLKHREVVTLRDHQIAQGVHDLATGNYRKGTTKFFGKGTCEQIATIKIKLELDLYVDNSGFSSVNEWLMEAAKFGSKLPLYLYHIILLQDYNNLTTPRGHAFDDTFFKQQKPNIPQQPITPHT